MLQSLKVTLLRHIIIIKKIIMHNNRKSRFCQQNKTPVLMYTVNAVDLQYCINQDSLWLIFLPWTSMNGTVRVSSVSCKYCAEFDSQ